ncbi:hypothetical protein GMMP15_550003 [Candidatus Magnetomoraceae bacterium gMMP-15]
MGLAPQIITTIISLMHIGLAPQIIANEFSIRRPNKSYSFIIDR